MKSQNNRGNEYGKKCDYIDIKMRFENKLKVWFLWPLGIAIVNWVSNEALNLSFTTHPKLQVVPTKYSFEVSNPTHKLKLQLFTDRNIFEYLG